MAATQSEYGVWHGDRTEFARVPMRVITDPRLTAFAVRIYAYMLGVVTRPVSANPDGRWILRRRDIMRQCRIGTGAWTTAARQLRQVGLYLGTRERKDDGSGQYTYVHHVYPADGSYGNDPATTPRRPTPRRPTPRRPTPRRPDTAPATPHTLSGTKHERGSSSTNVLENAVSNAAATFRPARRRQCTRRTSGIDCWTESDLALAAALEERESADDIAAAVASLPVTKAVPGVVAKAIERIKASRNRGTGQPVTLAEPDPVRRVRAESYLAELSAARGTRGGA